MVRAHACCRISAWSSSPLAQNIHRQQRHTKAARSTNCQKIQVADEKSTQTNGVTALSMVCTQSMFSRPNVNPGELVFLWTLRL
jgi:hypothetical protein